MKDHVFLQGPSRTIKGRGRTLVRKEVPRDKVNDHIHQIFGSRPDIHMGVTKFQESSVSTFYTKRGRERERHIIFYRCVCFLILIYEYGG